MTSLRPRLVPRLSTATLPRSTLLLLRSDVNVKLSRAAPPTRRRFAASAAPGPWTGPLLPRERTRAALGAVDAAAAASAASGLASAATSVSLAQVALWAAMAAAVWKLGGAWARWVWTRLFPARRTVEERFEDAMRAWEERRGSGGGEVAPAPVPVPDGEMLRVWALQRQALFGDAKEDEMPWWWRRDARTKWDAWAGLRGMPPTEAKEKFVQAVNVLLGRPDVVGSVWSRR